jgi:hypothetical protein
MTTSKTLIRTVGLLGVSSAVFAGCAEDGSSRRMSREIAEAALDDVSASTEALSLATGQIGLFVDARTGTSLDAALELAAHLSTTLPCADVDDDVLVVHYDACEDVRIGGSHRVRVMASDEDGLTVRHEFEHFSSNRSEIDGKLVVVWSRLGQVELTYALAFMRTRDGARGTVAGTSRFEAYGGLWQGVYTLDGQHVAVGSAGASRLTLEGQRTRWMDPVPEAGVITAVRDSGTAVIEFERASERSIIATVETDEGDRVVAYATLP